MKRSLLTILLVGVFVPSAQSAWCDYTPVVTTYSCSYHVLDESAKTCEFIYTYGDDNIYAASPAVNPKPEGKFKFPATLGGYTVTRVGEGGFWSCVWMKTAILPETVRYVDKNAFHACQRMTEFPTMPGVVEIGETAFYDCRSLTSATLPEGLVTIQKLAFKNCSNLGSVTLPTTLRTVGGKLFEGCTNTLCVYDASWEHWMSIENTNYRSNGSILDKPDDVTLYLAGKPVTDLSAMPSTIRSIRENAFAGYGRLAIDRLPSFVTNVCTYAFANCPKITSFVFNDTKTQFAPCAFTGTSIKQVQLPTWMTDIPEGLFYDCNSLTNVTFHSGVTSIGENAFYDCGNLKGIQLPEHLTSIGRDAFAFCTTLNITNIPDTVTNIDDSAFYKNWYLESVHLPSALKKLGARAFFNCRSLREITIPPTVTNIGAYCFAKCSLLTNVAILASVSRMDDVFQECSTLRNVKMYGPMPTTFSCLYLNTPTNLLTTVVGYDVSWSNALASGSWNARPIVCLDTWKVRFDLGTKGVHTGGGALEQTAETYGSVIAPTVECTDEDYVFAGWDHSLTDIRFFTTIKAVYEPKPMAVKGTSSVSLMRFDDAASVQLTAFGGVKPYVWSAVSGLPAGLSISEDGILSGNTAFLGTTAVNFQVTDSRNESATLAYTLTVTENPDGKPVIDARTPEVESPVVGRGGARSFGVTAHDPEGQTLAYRWFVDGVETNGVTGATFDYADPDDGCTAHAIRCVVEDAVWKGDYTTGTTWIVRTLLPPDIFSNEGTFFHAGTGEVSITCNIAEAEIFYALDGVPQATEEFRYTGPFELPQSATVWALARCGGFVTSCTGLSFIVATPTFCNPVGAGEDVQFTTGGDAEWAPEGNTLRSGAVEPNQESWLKASFNGKGTFDFKWKVNCENDSDGTCSRDALEIYVDGDPVRQEAIDGVCDWVSRSLAFDEKCDHTILWRFVRDDADEPNADYLNCGWIAEVSWTPTDPLPELSLAATAEEIAEALAEVADPQIREHITTAARYARFRAWVLELAAAHSLTVEEILANLHLWQAFAFAQSALLTEALTDESLKIRTFTPELSAVLPSFVLTVSVGDLTVPSTANLEDLAEAVGVIGSAALDSSSFDAANVSVQFSVPQDGDLTLTACPKEASDAFFFCLDLK